MTAGSVSSDAQLAKIARGGAINLVGSFVAGISGFVLTVIVTNGWDRATAGVLFSATSLFLILTATGLLGTDTGLARFVLRYESTGAGADIPALLKVALWPVLGLSVALAAVLAVFAGEIRHWVGLPEQAVPVLIILALVLPLTVLSDSTLAANQAFGRMRPTVLVDRLLRSGGQPALIALAAVLGAGLTGLALAWALPYVLAAMIAPVLLLRTVAARGARAPHPHPARPIGEIRREFWSYTWFRGVGRLFQVALQRADIILVAALRSPAEAALYTAATRFVILGQMGVQAIQQVLQPRLSQLLAMDDDVAVHRVFSTSTAWIMALSWPIYLTAVVAAPLYLSIFGDKYSDEGQLIVILMGLGMLLAMAAGPVDVVLLMAGRSSLSLINNGVALAVNIALNLVLIPAYGANGAAAAWAIALGVRNALPFWQVHRQLGLTGQSRATALVAAAAVGCFVLPMLVLRFTAGLQILPALVLLAACSVAYAGVLWRSRDLLELQAFRRGRRASRSA
jgi:O-antigen/teichoic acid export membrane protein